MIRLENVSKYYRNSSIATKGLDNISLNLNKGEIVAITGESGSGKSTLLNVISKIDNFDEGEIYYKGNETSYFNIDDMEQFRKNKIGFIFQNYNIIESYTVLENVMVPLLINGVDKKEAKKEATKLVKKVGLEKRINHKGTELSGGEKQRCVIARALASKSEVLACDEATGNLDSETSKEIIKLIKDVSEDKLVLIVTHNFDEVKDIVTRKIKLHDGRIIEDYYLKDYKGEEENEELDLDYVPIKRKTDFLVATNNLLSTPKKTIFSVIIFLVVSFIALLLFQFISTSVNDTGTTTNSFIYKGDNKLIAYNENNDILNIDVIKNITDKYVVNPFYESSSLSMPTSEVVITKDNYSEIGGYYSRHSYRSFGYETYPTNVNDNTLSLGRMPENENEVILLTNETDKDEIKEKFYNYYIPIVFSKDEIENFQIVGIEIRDDVLDYVITGSDKFQKYYKMKFMSNQLDFIINDNILLTAELSMNEKTKVITNKDITKLDAYYMNYLLFDFSDIEIEKTTEDISKIIIGYDFCDYIEKNPYEISVYGDVYSLKRRLNNNNISYINPETYSDYEIAIYTFIYKLVSYFFIVLASGSMVLIYFITYLIISRIYASKQASYAIFRTLGVTKKDMNRISRYELMTEVIFSSVFVYFLFFILGKTINNSFFNTFKHIDVFVTIWYFVILFGLGLLLALRFNRRLFKLTVNSTLKAGA